MKSKLILLLGLTLLVSAGLAQPTVTSINRNNPLETLTNAGNVTYEVKFSEGVTGVDPTDFEMPAATVVGASVTSVTPSTDAIYLVEVSTGTGNGTIRLDLKASGTGIANKDATPVAIATGFNSGEVYDIDKSEPTVTSITRKAASPTNSASVVFTILFSESVTGVDNSDFSLNNSGATGTITTCTGSGTTYEVTVNPVSSNGGTLGLDLKSSGTGIVDAASNSISGGLTGETYTIDNVVPTVTSITRNTASPTNANSVVFTVLFSESVTGVDNSDFNLNVSGATGTITTCTGSGTTYVVTVNPVSSNGGTLGLALKSSGTGIVDGLSNAISGGFTGETYTIDNVVPTVTSINRKTPASASTNATSLVYSITFSESVSGVDILDFALATTGGAAGTIDNVSSASGTSIDVTITPVSSNGGTLRLDLNSSGTIITDVLGNSVSGGFTSGQVYTVDNVAPSAPSKPDLSSGSDSGVSDNDNNTNIDTPTFTGTAEAGATIKIYDGAILLGTIVATGGNWTYSQVIALTEGGHTISATAADSYGNVSTSSSGLTITIDKTKPNLTISSTAPDPTNGKPVPFQVQFNEDVSGFDLTDITMSTNPSGKGTKQTFNTLNASTYTFEVNIDATLKVNIYINVAAGVCQDIAGNTNNIAIQFQIYYNDDKPSILSITTTQNSPTNASTINVTVLFDEQVQGFALGDLAIGNGIASNFSANSNKREYYFDITPTTDGIVTIDIPAGVCTDFKSPTPYVNYAATQKAIVSDRTKPTLSYVNIQSSNSNQAYAKLGDVVTLSFTSIEDIKTPTVTIKSTSVTATGGPRNWTASRSIIAETEGAVTLNIAFEDMAGNTATPNVTATTNSSSVTVDRTNPSFTSISAPSGIYGIGSIIPITIISDANSHSLMGIATINGQTADFVNAGGNKYMVYYTVQATHANLNGSSSIDANIVLKDLAGNNSTISSIPLIGGNGKISINTKPSYQVTGIASHCANIPTVPVTFTFTGVPPYNFTYTDGITSIAETNWPSNTYIVNASQGTYRLTNLSDNSGGLAATDYTASFTVTQYELPDFSIISATQTINQKANKYRLLDNITITPPGGVSLFTGNYVGYESTLGGYYFYPSLESTPPSNNTISYKLTNSNGCEKSGTFNLTIIGDKPYFSGIDKNPPYCNPTGGSSDDISVQGIVGSITTQNLSIAGGIQGTHWIWNGTNLDGKITIFPAEFTDGWHRITYTYTQGPNTYNVIDSCKIVRVSTLVDFELLAPKYCRNDSTITLVAKNFSPLGGYGHFNGPTTGFYSADKSNSATFTPKIAPVDQLIKITYYYETQDGCVSPTKERETRVNSLPTIDFTIKDNYNYDSAEEVLVGSPTGGTFNGSIIVGGTTIKPSLTKDSELGSSTKVFYTYKDVSGTGCTNTTDKSTKVWRANQPITGLASKYCWIDQTYNISCSPNADGLKQGIFTSKNGAITQSTVPGNSADYSIPKAAFKGAEIDTVWFRYQVGSTDYEVVKTVLLDSIGNLNMNIINHKRFCRTDPLITISGFQTHTNGVGIYSYDGTAGVLTFPSGIPTFDPSLETINGNHKIKYIYTSNDYNACSKEISRTVSVNPVPLVEFELIKDCTDGVNSPIGFNNLTNPNGSVISKWNWNWDDNTSSTLEQPLSHTYISIGPKTVVLTATTDSSCVANFEYPFNIGVNPIADFTWDSDCQTANPVMFTDKSINGVYKDWVWKFNGVVQPSSNDTIYLSLPDLRRYEVELIATTTDNCTDAIKKDIIIHPYINFATNSFKLYDFEDNKNYWIAKDSLSDSWTNDMPNGSIIKSDSKAWYTDVSLGNQKAENSSIVSPCFDLSELKKPMLKMRLWSAPEPGRDGAVLQYTIDSAATWHNLGKTGEGINWFTPNNIGSEPAGQSYGWSSDPSMTDWAIARHDLDTLKGLSYVQFRFVYANEANNIKPFNGFAFDDFWVGERQQSLLGEYFTNTTSVLENDYLKEFEERNNEDIIPIHYHNSDGLFDIYKEGPSSRMFYYGVRSIPGIFANGTIFSNLSDKTDFEIKADAATLMDPKISIDKLEVVNGEVKMVLKALTDISNENLVLYCALVKDSIQIGNTGTYYYNVLRRFLPSPGGTALSVGNWVSGDVINQSISLSSITNSAEFINSKLVVFVQNSSTNSVYQVGSIKTSILTSEHPMDLSNLVDVYPNPARDYLIIDCEHTIDRLMVFDLAGRVIGSYIPSQSRYSLPVQDLQNGIYILKGFTKKGEFIRKFVKQ